MWMNLARGLIAAVVVMGVTEISRRYPRYGGLLLSLPLVSILAFVMAWTKHHDLRAIASLAKETVVLVIIGLPFFLPLALAPRLHLSFWPAFLLGICLAAATISLWLYLAPE